jgi:hypothetical protein
MQHHTLILSTPKLHFPEKITITYVTNLLHRGLLLIEYFGIEIDNQPDYIDQDMEEASHKFTYIDFHFDTEESIDYDSLSITDVEHLIDNIIKQSDTIDLRVNEKDIVVNL